MDANTRLGAPCHGRTGPLHVEDRRYTHELSRAWVEAAVAWGLMPTGDFNGAAQEGAGLYQDTPKRGRRCPAADGLWVPKTCATWVDAPTERGRFGQALGVGRAGLGSAGGGMIFGLWA